MKVINGHTYSTKRFDEYKFRAKVRATKVGSEHNIDLYTTNLDKEEVENVLIDRRSPDVTSIQIIHWTTKEQDDLANKFIDEWLNSEL